MVAAFDPESVANQYRDGSNLNARIALHERFSTNKYGLQRWIFDQFELRTECRILEIGCGPGGLWKENLDRTPEGWDITLTDASPGMVSEAERGLGDRFHFQVADARELPFESGRFDAVIADHMLYHVPDRPRALHEITRVLKRDGTLYAATNGEKSMRGMGRMMRVLDPAHSGEGPSKVLSAFSLENGAEQLSPYFSRVSLRRYEDALLVTEAKPLVDYLLSGMTVCTAAERTPEKEFRARGSRLTESLERELASEGSILIPKDAGLFVARL